MRLPFIKMHGLGNDFVILDGREIDLPSLDTAQICALADRHRGIGFDQLIVLGHRNVVDGTPVRVVKRRPSKTANDATPAPKAPENAGEPEGQEEVEK